MLQITDIQAQKKRAGYYSIFVNEEYSFSLSDLDLSAANLHVGQTVAQQELEQLKKTSLTAKAYNRALYYLKYGPRTVWQMRQYLERKGGFGEEEISSAIQGLEKDKYLNDAAYVDSYLNSRQAYKPSSKRQLNAELRKKGIDSKIIEERLSELDDESQKTAVLQIVQKKINQPKYKDKKKLTEYLVRQGFPYGLVKKALEEFSSEYS